MVDYPHGGPVPAKADPVMAKPALSAAPKVGDFVHFWEWPGTPGHNHNQLEPCMAFVAGVNPDKTVNLAVFDVNGSARAVGSVDFTGDKMSEPTDHRGRHYCCAPGALQTKAEHLAGPSKAPTKMVYPQRAMNKGPAVPSVGAPGYPTYPRPPVAPGQAPRPTFGPPLQK